MNLTTALVESQHYTAAAKNPNDLATSVFVVSPEDGGLCSVRVYDGEGPVGKEGRLSTSEIEATFPGANWFPVDEYGKWGNDAE